eukprot:8225423-Pyramimonas_sp.AAC.1
MEQFVPSVFSLFLSIPPVEGQARLKSTVCGAFARHPHNRVSRLSGPAQEGGEGPEASVRVRFPSPSIQEIRVDLQKFVYVAPRSCGQE